MRKQEIDIILNKFISRKLMAFAIACIALFLGNLTSVDWVIIATASMSAYANNHLVPKSVWLSAVQTFIGLGITGGLGWNGVASGTNEDIYICTITSTTGDIYEQAGGSTGNLYKLQ